MIRYYLSMHIIKSNYDNSNYSKSKTNKLSIRFGDSLRLLSVRQIITLMQACSSNQFVLRDIHAIDVSYSSGAELFLYRQTFQNVEPFTFKSLLLLLQTLLYTNTISGVTDRALY